MIKIISPLYLQLSKGVKGKKYYLNLNNYRNWHYIVSNNLKKAYKELMKSELGDLDITGRIEIKFLLIRGDSRKVDRANVLSVHEKFFCDALVELGCIEDDNDKFIVRTIYESGEIDRGKGRVEIFINSVD
jgi:Holliday junction resolvase RusA-like endonuclease